MGSKKKAKPQEVPAEGSAQAEGITPANPDINEQAEESSCPAPEVSEQVPTGEEAENKEGASTSEPSREAAERESKASTGEDASSASADGERKSAPDEDNDSIDWLTIVLMIAVMANIAYWIWVRDNSITGDVEMHRPPGVASAMANEGSGPPPGPNEGQDSFGEEIGTLEGIRGDDPEHDLVRTYIVIANALEISGICDVHTVWDLDKKVLEAASSPDGGAKEKELVKAAYDEAIKLMRQAYTETFEEECRKADTDTQQAARNIFNEAVALVDSKPLEAMARFEDSLLRLRAGAAFDDHNPNGQPAPGSDNPPAPGPDNPPAPGPDNQPGNPPAPGPDNPPAPGPDNPPAPGPEEPR